MFDQDHYSSLRAYIHTSGKNAWIGTEKPLKPEFAEVNLFAREGYRANSEESGNFDTVWLIQKPIDIQGWRILVDSSLRLLGPSGVLVLRYVQNQYISVINLKNFLFRKYGVRAEVLEEKVVDGEFLTVFRIFRIECSTKMQSDWTFGILTQGKKPEVVERFCRTVREYGGPAHEIIIVGPENKLYAPYQPTYIRKEYSKTLSDICIKKNDIVIAAQKENICILHDRYWLSPDFFSGFEKFGYDFEFVTIRQNHESGKNYPSYCAIDDRCHLIWGQIYECGNEIETWNRHYLNGGLIIAKRSVLREVPFNALIFHNQAEDVELAKEMEGRSIVPRINRFSSAVTDVPDHLTDAFKVAEHSDYESVFFPKSNIRVETMKEPGSHEQSNPLVNAQCVGLTDACAPMRSNTVPPKAPTRVDRVLEKVQRRREAGASWKGIAFLGTQFLYRRMRSKLTVQNARSENSRSKLSAREDTENSVHQGSPSSAAITKCPYAVQPFQSAGVNIILYAADAGGVVNLTIHYLRSLIRKEVPFCVVDIQRGEAGSVLPRDLLQFVRDEPIYPTNIWCIGFPFIAHHLNVLHFWAEGRWNINFTHWELPRIPRRLVHNFDVVDSIIVDSEFVGDAIGKVTDKPIEIVDPEVRVDRADLAKYTRQYFGLPENKILFLLNWEFTSSTIRKNPLAGIRAFDGAFHGKTDDVALVMHVKFENRHGEEKRAEYERFLADVHASYPHVVVLAQNSFTYEEALGLKATCDCYISLHRSEGYGMGCAEALALGRRCVMTGWSGNMELVKQESWRNQIYTVDAVPIEVAPSDFPWVEKDDEVLQYWADVKVEDAIRKIENAYRDIKSGAH